MYHKKMKLNLPGKGRSKRKFLNGASRPDLSSLRKPVDTSVSDLGQVCDLLEDGTDEVKSLLSHECNVIYECRVCLSLFRSIVNLVSHKREYCREKCDVTLHKRVNNAPFARESIIHMYKTDEQPCDEGVKNDRILRSQVPKESNRKDLTAVIDMLKRRDVHAEGQQESENATPNVLADRRIYLEAIDTNCSAVYQTVDSSDAAVGAIDLMKEQITELQVIEDQKAIAVEGQVPEHQSEKSDSPIQGNMSDEENELLIYRLPMNNNELSCSICKLGFATRKTLTFHMKTMHSSKRLCYPCPCCSSAFANTWSVYRHLCKVHKKTNDQVRKLRWQIQEKAFHRKTTSGTRSARAAKESTVKNVDNSDATQEPISHVEPDAKPCGRKRGRKSKRKASPTRLPCCQVPVAECDETATVEQCNITDDTPCKTEDIKVADIVVNSDEETSSKNSEYRSSPESYHETSILVQDISSLGEEQWNILGTSCKKPDITPPDVDDSLFRSLAENQDNFKSDENSKSSDVVCMDTSEVSSAASKMRNKREQASNCHNGKRSTDSKEGVQTEVEEDDSKSQSSCSTSPNNGNQTMESKIAAIANFRKQRCLQCKRKFTSIPNLRRHVAVHVDWNRYRCKLCDFKCFAKCDCVTHCNKVHNMQVRTAIAEMVLEIPQDEGNEDVTSPKVNSDDPAAAIVTEVTAASCQQQTRVDCNGLDTHAVSQNEENERDAECCDANAGDSDKTAREPDLLDCIANCRKLDDCPKLKEMVMKVIFGPSMGAIKASKTDSDKTVVETSDDAGGRVDANDNVKNAATVDEAKEACCSALSKVKHQRPIRNRIKPLSNDFIYDLKEVTHRKESALINDSETVHVRKKAKLY